MRIASQDFLRTLDSNRSDTGLSYREIMVLDKNSDGQLTGAETSHKLSARDLQTLNLRLSTHKQLQHSFAFIDDNSEVFSRSELNSTLFPGGVDGISAHDIDQGGVGDCYLMAALAGLAEARPRDIISMITENANGTFTVKFPGISKKITVSKPTDSELDKYAHRGRNGSTWVAVLEKAFAQYSKDQAWFKDAERGDIDGGFLSTGIHPITGHSTNTDTLALTWKSTTRSRIQNALKNKRVITASVNSLFGDKKSENQYNLPAQHVYTILSYDKATDTLRVRNPWGWGSDAKNFKHSDDTNDGIFTMTIDEFYERFSFIGYEEGH